MMPTDTLLAQMFYDSDNDSKFDIAKHPYYLQQKAAQEFALQEGHLDSFGNPFKIEGATVAECQQRINDYNNLKTNTQLEPCVAFLEGGKYYLYGGYGRSAALALSAKTIKVKVVEAPPKDSDKFKYYTSDKNIVLEAKDVEVVQ